MPYKDANKQREYNKNYSKEWHEKNKEYRRRQIKYRKLEIVRWLKEYKSTLYCSECGENRVACLDFHHTDPNEKIITIGYAARRGWGIERIVNEINKCVVLCSNCHRILHYDEIST